VTENSLLSVKNLGRTFTLGSEQINAIHDINLDVDRSELLLITGRSGSGKTTLLNLLAGLDRPTTGTILIEGENLAELPESALVKLRRRRIGFVFQSFGLLPLLSAYENIELPLRIAGWNRSERHKRTLACLEMVGLSSRANHRPWELSGGEQQRVAIARALAHRPALIIADEPTGDLDSNNAAAIFSLLRVIMQQEMCAVIVATHDVSATSFATTSRELHDGVFIN
jgi:putative ABC transport system ATP-binding protein